MPEIKTLIRDVYKIAGKVPVSVSADIEPHASRGTLRLSQLGPWCPKALWYSVNKPEVEEFPEPWVQIKFNYGHLTEALAIAYAKASGHSVTGEQDELSADGIRGHRDCVIDGCLVDVKSCSSRHLQKFKTGSIVDDDSFGYLDQLDGYLVGSASDPLVTVKDRAYIWAVDKTLGHMVLYEHKLREASIRERIRQYKAIVELSEPPRCECGTKPYGESGNRVLDTRASYSSFKHTCFPYLRTFIYSDGPVFFTTVVKRPTNQFGPLKEIDRHGNRVYN